MKFVEAMRYMLKKGKVCNKNLIISDYIYINGEDKIVNQFGYSVSIDVNDESWEIYEE